MEYAPIFVSVYDRNVHFRLCIESLQKNLLAGQSHLFVAIDAPSREQDREKNRKVVEYAKSIRRFKEVTLFIRETNLGPRQNWMQARDEIFSRYDRMIMFEDDNILAPDFLSFVNMGLDCYENRSDIFSVSGYNYPIAMPENYRRDVYLWKGFSAWGVGLWKEKWAKMDWSLSDMNDVLNSRKDIKKLNAIAEHYIPLLRTIKETGRITGDSLISLYHYKHNMYSVFPAVSRVRNIGHDGSGVHCGYDDVYAAQPISEGSREASMPLDITTDPIIDKILWEHFRLGRMNKIRSNVKIFAQLMGFMSPQTREMK